MKRFFALLFIVLFLALCLVPSLGLLITGGAEAAANQVLAAKPALQKRDGSLNTAWLEELARYVNDRFFLRQEAVTLWARLNAELLSSSVTDQVVLGRDGWLYFSATLPDYTRTAPMSGRERWCAARRLWLLQEYVEAQGGQFLFTVAPNKNSLYDRHMPALPRGDGPSNAEALAEALSVMGVHYLDLFTVFRAQSEPLYFPCDSHWTSRGAALAADAILTALGRESAYFTMDYTDGRHRGDLYEMLYPTGTETDPDRVPADGLRFEASSANPDSISIRTQSDSGSGTLLMYRDSFGRALYPYLAATYAESFFSRKNDYDPTLLQSGGTLVIELVERNLRYLLSYAPTLPAAPRDSALADGARESDTQLEFQLAKGGLEGYNILYGDLNGCTPDEASPIYIDTVLGLFEALPGAEDFSLCLPEEAAEGPIRVLLCEKGEWLSLAGVPAP